MSDERVSEGEARGDERGEDIMEGLTSPGRTLVLL